jgi:hypothetical protein
VVRGVFWESACINTNTLQLSLLYLYSYNVINNKPRYSVPNFDKNCVIKDVTSNIHLLWLIMAICVNLRELASYLIYCGVVVNFADRSICLSSVRLRRNSLLQLHLSDLSVYRRVSIYLSVLLFISQRCMPARIRTKTWRFGCKPGELI